MINDGIPVPARLRILADGQVQTPGFNYYETGKLTVVARNRKSIVLKVPGGKVWDGNCSPRRYVPPMLMVFRIIKTHEDGLLDVEGLIEWTTGRKKPDEIGRAHV